MYFRKRGYDEACSSPIFRGRAEGIANRKSSVLSEQEVFARPHEIGGHVSDIARTDEAQRSNKKQGSVLIIATLCSCNHFMDITGLLVWILGYVDFKDWR